MVWTLASSDLGSKFDFGTADSSTGTIINSHNPAGNLVVRAGNVSTQVNAVTPSGTGLVGAVRPSTSLLQAVRNGVVLGSATDTSPASDFGSGNALLLRSSTYYSPRQLGLNIVSRSLSSSELTAIYKRAPRLHAGGGRGGVNHLPRT